MTTLNVLAIPALSDNYIWLLADPAGRAVLVDPGDATPALQVLARDRLQLVAILLTHHHPDHIAGVADLTTAFPAAQVIAPVDERIAGVDHRVSDGDRIAIPGMALHFDVLSVPGHTLSHVAYHGDGLLFSGDTLFSAGCGRLFEGTPAQMLASLDRLAALPASTRVCCGHEYTAANLAFARNIEPDNVALEMRSAEVQAMRAAGQPSLPSTLTSELACNPFLRIDQPAVIAALDGAGQSRSERFGELRRRKDQFR